MGNHIWPLYLFNKCLDMTCFCEFMDEIIIIISADIDLGRINNVSAAFRRNEITVIVFFILTRTLICYRYVVSDAPKAIFSTL